VGVVSLLCLGLLSSGGGAGTPRNPSAVSPAIGGVAVERSSPVGSSLAPAASDGPHPGTLEIWESTVGGPSEADPSVCYYTVCTEPISNVYETLIAYNGTQDGPTPASYVPEIATCVPGSLECAAQFGGNDLVWNNNSTGAPQYYTFEIDAGARFYDPTTGAGWPVFPSDVLFTFARTMGFADLPYEEATPGWINSQDLVPTGQHSYDGALHYPLNNTPQHILGAFLVNDSYYCPRSPDLKTNGCITFNVGGSGTAWPFFLELVAEPLGASIEPCGWYSANGGGVPGFNGTYANSNGDGPCWLPGNASSTQQEPFERYVSSTSPRGWDSFEEEALNLPAVQPGVQWSDVGSGPYYVENPIDPNEGYTLHANPDFHTPVGCVNESGCLPPMDGYIKNVDVVWEATGDTLGLTEMSAGVADSAGFFSTDTRTVQALSDYTLTAGVPSLSIDFDPLVLNFSVSDAQLEDGGPLNVAGNFLQNVALRQFLVDAYPYRSIDSEFSTVNGTVFGEPYGGAIPQGMGDFYPTNITWPSGNPNPNSSQVGNIAWWWAEANNASSPWYDPALSNCTPVAPCQWPTVTSFGNLITSSEFSEWNREVFNLSDGALEPYVVSGTCMLESCCGLPCPPGNPWPVYPAGWAPDYPDPTDYVAPMYYPDNSYTAPDAVSETLQAAPNNDSSCPHDFGAWSNLTYYANIGQLPTGCQGGAYDTMVAWMNAASDQTNLTYRTLEYNLIEHIANELALYVYDPEQLTVIDHANWIEGSTINLNPMFGGGGVQLWFDWEYASNFFNTTFTEAGLPSGTSWSVRLGDMTENATAPQAIVFSPIVNGSYPYSVGPEPGYLAALPTGNVSIAGSSAAVLEVFSTLAGHPSGVIFDETGLRPGTPWSVLVTGPSVMDTLRGNSSVLNESLAAGSYSYQPAPVPGYTAPSGGQFSVTDQEVMVNLTFHGVVPPPYRVSFTETGLTLGSPWSVFVNGSTVNGSSVTLSVGLPNGSYTWAIASEPVGTIGSPVGGSFTIQGAPTTVTIAFSAWTAHGPILTAGPSSFLTNPLTWILVGGFAAGVMGLVVYHRSRATERRANGSSSRGDAGPPPTS
jgi:hypothetical protein